MKAQKDLLDYMVEGLVDALWKLLKGLVVVMLVMPMARAEDATEATVDSNTALEKSEEQQVKEFQEKNMTGDELLEFVLGPQEPLIEHKRINWQRYGEGRHTVCKYNDDCATGADCMLPVSNGKASAYGMCVCFNQSGCNGRLYYTNGKIKVLKFGD